MRFLKILFLGLAILIIGGFAYFAFTDVNIQQQDVTKTLPAENFLK